LLLLSIKIYRNCSVRKAYCLLFIGLMYNGAFAQNVATINGKPLTSREFMWVYKKSHNGNSTTDYNKLQEYLWQYINFKLKVLDAREMGLDQDSSYKSEIKVYEDAVAAHRKPGSKNKEKDYLLSEYREGVLMFNVSEEKIWNRVQQDDEGLRAFFDQNHKKYADKPLNEIRGQVMTDYQQFLENNWIKFLQQKYQIKINENELKKLTKQ